jgi:hypothetical protein
MMEVSGLAGANRTYVVAVPLVIMLRANQNRFLLIVQKGEGSC